MHQLPSPPGASSSALLASAALLVWLLVSWRWPIWMVIGFLWTAYHIEQRLQLYFDPELAGQDLWVAGWVDSFPNHAPGQVTFSLRLPPAERPTGVPGRLRLTWYEPPIELEAGNALRLKVRLKEPRGLSNPGGFDYERWLFLEGYRATGYVREGDRQRDASIGPARWWLMKRADLARKITAATPGTDAPVLLTALALGERFGFEERHWEGLRRTGTSHLMAISGLHIGLVAALSFFLVRRIWIRLPGVLAHYDLPSAALVSFACAALYAAAAGFAIPTQRALLMLSVAYLAVLTRRFVSMTAGLSTALLFVLFWDPLMIISPSFWLSFVAVGLLWQLGQSRTGFAQNSKFRKSARIQWGICLGLTPVVVLFFGEISLVAPVVNFVAIPIFTLVLVPLTLLATLTLSVDFLGPYLMYGAGLLAQSVWWALEFIASWSWSAIALPQADRWQFVLAVIGVIFALPIHPLPCRYLSAFAILPLLVVQTDGPKPGVAVATVLDVGHGLAVIVETRNHVLLYDAGPRYRSGFDSGSEIVLPALRANGRTRLDTIVISHADTDHSGGAAAVIDSFPRAQLIVGPDVTLLHASACQGGQSWVWDGVEFSFLHPPARYTSLGNDSSCVLKVTTRAGALVITGDIESRGERALLSQVPRLRADVVIVPHHGSATSSTPALVDAMNAQYAVVSTGYTNQWGFPRPEVRARWEASGAKVVTTGASGAITIALGSSGEPRLTFRRDRRRRYWHGVPRGSSG